MGVVYEAADQKLGRHVAVKLLSEATRDSSAALERFWREARAASSLNHPGICTIYELNDTAKSPFIVMELLEGSSLEKLNDKLYRGNAMPPVKLVELGVQLADALDAAHRKGILHRDIKPANIFIIHSGQAKLLDFGLAKVDGDSASPDAGAQADAPTAANPLTSSGSSVGTVAYMSPEQARGEALDARSDLFSLGVVLYEMATGQHPFPGATTAVVFDRILNQAPVAPITLNSTLPAELENILNKTLEKDRELRCQSAAELRADLKRLQRKSGSGSTGNAGQFASTPSLGPSASSSSAVASAQTPSSAGSPRPPLAAGELPGDGVASPRMVAASASGKSRGLVVGVAALVVLAAAGFGVWRFWPRSRPFATVSVAQITNIGSIENVAISGDGRFLAEVKNDKGQRTLWVRNVATSTDTQILGAFANAYIGLTFSPDANYLYFVRGTPDNTAVRALYAMPVFGGTPKQLEYDIDSGVSFSPDGGQFTYVKWTPDRNDQFTELHVVDKDGGNNQVILATMEVVEPPVWSPDGSRIAWIAPVTGTQRTAVYWIDLASKKVSSVGSPADIRFTAHQRSLNSLAWLPDSRRLLVTFDKTHTDRTQIGIIAIPSGEFHPITSDVNTYSQLALSGDGRTLATVLTEIDSSIASYKPQGGSPLSTTPLRITPVSITWADEKRLLFVLPGISVGSIDLATGAPQTFDVGDLQIGTWLAACSDGHILFTGIPKGAGQARIFRMNGDGGALTQFTSNGVARAPFCSPDSLQVYFTLRSVPQYPATESAVWVEPLAGGMPRQVLPANKFFGAAFSPDGKLVGSIYVDALAYTLRITDLATGRALYSVPAETSDFGGAWHFSPDGRALVYPVLRNGGHTLLYQPVDGSPAHLLLDAASESIRDFGWSPSGKQLAALRVKSSSDVVLIRDEQGKGNN